MGREVIRGVAAPVGVLSTQSPPDTYKDRLLKYIPGEVIVLWGTLATVIEQSTIEANLKLPIHWGVFAVLLIATPFYQYRILNVRFPKQLAIATVAFAIWVFYLGEPFASTFLWYNPLYGAILLPLFTFLVPLFEP